MYEKIHEHHIEYRPVERKFILGDQVIHNLAGVNWCPDDLLQIFEPQQIEEMIREQQKQKREQEETCRKFLEMDISKKREKFRWYIITAIAGLIIILKK